MAEEHEWFSWVASFDNVKVQTTSICVSSRWVRNPQEHLGISGTGASVKDAVKAGLGQKAIVVTSPSKSGLGSDEEERVRFWARPALDSPTLQQRLWHAWGAVQSPTGGQQPCLVISPSCCVLFSSRSVRHHHLLCHQKHLCDNYTVRASRLA